MHIVEPSHVIITSISVEDAYGCIERAGRTAYKSEDRITPGSSSKLIASIIGRGHESVLEHYGFSVRFICDRGVSHEIVRHRLCAFTQESTRYCNYSKLGVTFVRPVFWRPNTSPLYRKWLAAMGNAEEAYNFLMERGATPQEARSVLPNSLKTEIVVTANVREWRHILKLRTSSANHPQMRELMLPLLGELRIRLPVLFQDIPLPGDYQLVPRHVGEE